jgi:outer membrane immunogenic protein
MKKLLLGIATLTTIAAAPAVAADMPVKAVPLVEYHYSWTGCYLAGGGGYGMFNAEHDQSVTGPIALGVPFAVGTRSTATENAGGKGWIGTVGAGCDMQFGGKFLVGILADFDWSNIRGQTDTFSRSFGDGSAIASVGTLRQKSSWDVGGRAGWIVVPQLLTYVSGGYTEARFDAVDFTAKLVPFIGNATGLQLPAQTRHGWFFGGGTEYAISALPGLFWKNEYRYSSYRAGTASLNCVAASVGVAATCTGATGATGFSDRYSINVQTVRTELVWRWNWGGSVRAAY